MLDWFKKIFKLKEEKVKCIHVIISARWTGQRACMRCGMKELPPFIELINDPVMYAGTSNIDKKYSKSYIDELERKHKIFLQEKEKMQREMQREIDEQDIRFIIE